MLRSILNVFLFTTIFTSSAWAATNGPSNSVAVKAETKAEDLNNFFIQGKDASVTDDKIKREVERANAIAADLLNKYNKGVSEGALTDPNITRIRNKFDAIADATLAQDRDKILEFLGLDPNGDAGLYIFVSWSMPIELIRSYVIEAMWSGASLVFRGAPPDRPLGKFFTEDLRSLVYSKGASATISVDPRVYDAFNIQTVPSIVFIRDKNNFECNTYQYVPFKDDKGEIHRFEACPPMNEDTYDKITGAVTLSYALDLFIENGNKDAIPFKTALSKGLSGKNSGPKEQVPFTGKWDDVLSPDELKASQQTLLPYKNMSIAPLQEEAPSNLKK